MNRFELKTTSLHDLIVLEPIEIKDHRGGFMELYNKNAFKELGISVDFVQMNQSISYKSVLRGLHFQNRYPQDKLILVTEGEIFDVVVDIRPNSDTFGKWYGIMLSQQNKRMLFVPKHFAHGFIVRSHLAKVCYYVSEYRHPEDEYGIKWDDPDLSIDWGNIDEVITSAKDSALPTFQYIVDNVINQ